MQYFSVVAVFCLSFVAAQEAATQPQTTNNAPASPPATSEDTQTRFGSLSVPLRVSGQNFTVRFSPEKRSSINVATQICTDKATEIGVTEENYQGCVTNIANYLQQYVENWTNEKILRFPVSINETEFNLRFIPEIRSSKELSVELCNQYSNVTGLSFTDDNACNLPVQRYIQQRINAFYAEKTLELPLTLNNNLTLTVRFLPERQSPIEVATQICINYAKPLELTEETIRGNCIAPITNYLTDQVSRWVQSKTLEFSFQVNGKAYSVSFLPERTSPTNVAQEFCVQNAQELSLTNENIINNCIQPMANLFTNTVQEWIDSKRVSIPVSFAGKEVNVVFMPERETVNTVARDVCLRQVESLGLTNENFVSECVNPLTSVLRQGLNSWVAQRRQQQQQAQAQTQPQP